MLLVLEVGIRMDFKERKARRTDYYNRFVFGWKLKDCIACNGSGRYDSHRSPKCGACNGTGKERYKPEDTDKAGGLC